ncbi:MAG: LegC family aminotransferase [Desulfobacteraceae bacterium]|jgi:perosamine synthetase
MTVQEKIQRIEKAIRLVYDRREGPIPLHAPCFQGREADYVQDCIYSGWVSSVGEYVSRFERMVAEFTGAPHAVATVNGTAAILVSLVLAGVREGDGILCPAFSFVGTVSPVVSCKAVPVFMDSDPVSLGMDPRKVERFLLERCTLRQDGYTYDKTTGRRILACLPMHAYGYPADMAKLLDVCREYGVLVIEDAAEALGSRYGESHCGTMGILGILSFNGNKTITTGGGGMIITHDEDLARRAKHLTTTAKVDHPWDYMHDAVGYNFRMPNLNAALGCAQMEELESFLARKKEQAARLEGFLEGVEGVEVVSPDTGEANHWLNLARVPDEDRDDILYGLNARGIQARASWMPLCDMPPYRGYERFEIRSARELYASVICLPNGVLSDDDSSGA